ncbi:hypothetical protein Trydic_g23359 [Trypoxylus dichotomus]
MKTQRPVYKLMTGTEYLAEDLKQREHRKNEKNNSNAIKGDKISKWITKTYEVRITINGDAANMEKAENIYSTLNYETASIGRLVQKRISGNDIKFQILPPKVTKEKETKS